VTSDLQAQSSVLSPQFSAPPAPSSILNGLRICFIAGILEPGGAERQLYYTVRVLQEAGAKVHVLSLTRGDFWEEPIRRSEVQLTWVGKSSSRLVRLFKIVREVRRTGAVIVQCQHFYTNFYGSTTARMLGIREIGAVRNNVVSELADVGRIKAILNLRMPRMLAANSRAAIIALAKLGVRPTQTFFLPNVLDTERFAPGMRSARNGEGTIRLLAVGRLGEQKRFDRFIDLVALIQERTKLPVKGIIVGSGRPGRDLKPSLEQRAAKLGLSSGKLEFKGGVSEMETIYRDAEIFVSTSDHEGTPNVVLEAMASGLPVVATNVGGIPEIVQHGRTGYLVGTGELDKMAEWVIRLMMDRELRSVLGKQARTYIESSHSLTQLPTYLASLYDRTTRRHHNMENNAPTLSRMAPGLESEVKG